MNDFELYKKRIGSSFMDTKIKVFILFAYCNRYLC